MYTTLMLEDSLGLDYYFVKLSLKGEEAILTQASAIFKKIRISMPSFTELAIQVKNYGHQISWQSKNTSFTLINPSGRMLTKLQQLHEIQLLP